MSKEVSRLEAELLKIHEARTQAMKELSMHYSIIAADISRQTASIKGMQQVIVKTLPPSDTGYSISDLMIIEGQGENCSLKKIAAIAVETRSKHDNTTNKLVERVVDLKGQESECQNRLLAYTQIKRIRLTSAPVAEIIVVQDNKLYPGLIYFTLSTIIRPVETALDISKFDTLKNHKVTAYEVRHPSRLADPQMMFSRGIEHAIKIYSKM